MSLIRNMALACVASLASGCVAQPGGPPGLKAHDPLFYGPFLIGAERPSVGTHCLRTADVRSQDARGLWRPCPKENYAEQVMAADAVVVPVPPVASGGRPGFEGGAPPPPVATGRLPSRPRSAWDG